jgi:hypothetical protein
MAREAHGMHIVQGERQVGADAGNLPERSSKANRARYAFVVLAYVERALAHALRAGKCLFLQLLGRSCS